MHAVSSGADGVDRSPLLIDCDLAENDGMRTETKETFIEENQQVIRDYLLGQFKGFEVTDMPNPPLSHMFTVTRSSEEQYRVKVAWRQISDSGSTPAKLKRLLIAHDIAGRMRGKSQGEYFAWGNY